MSEVTWLIAWANKVKDYQVRALSSAIINEWVITWLAVTVNHIAIWSAAILVTRTNWQIFLVDFHNTEIKTIPTLTNSKIFIKIDQTKIDDWDTYITNTDWTWIAEIWVDSNRPSTWAYIKLASSDWSWVITDERSFISLIGWLLNNTDLTNLTWDITTTWDIEASTFYWSASWLTDISADIHSLTEITSLQDDDEHLVYDVTVSQNRKVKNSNMFVSDNFSVSRMKDAASWTVNYSHNLWKKPKLIIVDNVWSDLSNQWSVLSHWSWTNVWWNSCSYKHYVYVWMPSSLCIKSSWGTDYQEWYITNVTDTDFDIVWTKGGTWAPWFLFINFTLIW